MDERLLVERLRAGDPRAQAQAFQRYRRSLWRQALKIVRNPAHAEEIVHEAWINAMLAIHSFQGRSSLRTWLTSIVLNEARCHRRRESRTRPLSTLRAVEPDRSSRLPDDFADLTWLDRLRGRNEETPETIFLDREAASRVERALDTLSRTQRKVVVLRDFEGASSAEACDALALTDIAQRVHLCRARATLRRVLEEQERLCA